MFKSKPQNYCIRRSNFRNFTIIVNWKEKGFLFMRAFALSTSKPASSPRCSCEIPNCTLAAFRRVPITDIANFHQKEGDVQRLGL